MAPKITNPHIVNHRKLGKEKAHGLAWDEKNKIEIDINLTGYRYLLTALHEHFHLKHPEWSKVNKASSKTARLWGRRGFRFVELK